MYKLDHKTFIWLFNTLKIISEYYGFCINRQRIKSLESLNFKITKIAYIFA